MHACRIGTFRKKARDDESVLLRSAMAMPSQSPAARHERPRVQRDVREPPVAQGRLAAPGLARDGVRPAVQDEGDEVVAVPKVVRPRPAREAARFFQGGAPR